jgi:hypothetical protein
MQKLLGNRTIRKGLVDVGLALVGFVAVGITLMVGDLDPEIAAGISSAVGAGAATLRRILRDWAHGSPAS